MRVTWVKGRLPRLQNSGALLKRIKTYTLAETKPARYGQAVLVISPLLRFIQSFIILSLKVGFIRR